MTDGTLESFLISILQSLFRALMSILLPIINAGFLSILL